VVNRVPGPLADRNQDARGAVVIIIWLAALGFDVSLDVVRDDLVRAARLVRADDAPAPCSVRTPGSG
jgi:hypothetical protein